MNTNRTDYHLTVISFPPCNTNTYRWILWISLSIMMVESLTSLGVLVWKSLWRRYKRYCFPISTSLFSFKLLTSPFPVCSDFYLYRAKYFPNRFSPVLRDEKEDDPILDPAPEEQRVSNLPPLSLVKQQLI